MKETTIEYIQNKYGFYDGCSIHSDPNEIKKNLTAAMTEYASLKNKKANEFICDIAKLLGEDNLGLDDCQWSIDDFKEAIASLNRQGWTRVEDGLPELEQDVLIAWWCDSKVNGSGFWVVEVGYLQAIIRQKTKEGEKEFGEWKHGDSWNSSLPELWQPLIKPELKSMPLPNKPEPI